MNKNVFPTNVKEAKNSNYFTKLNPTARGVFIFLSLVGLIARKSNHLVFPRVHW